MESSKEVVAMIMADVNELWRVCCSSSPPKMGNDEHLHKAFAFFDQNQSGYMEKKKKRLRAALYDEVDTGSEDVTNAIMHDVDTSKDGRISYEEYAAMMKAATDWRKASRQYSWERFKYVWVLFNSLGSVAWREGLSKVYLATSQKRFSLLPIKPRGCPKESLSLFGC